MRYGGCLPILFVSTDSNYAYILMTKLILCLSLVVGEAALHAAEVDLHVCTWGCDNCLERPDSQWGCGRSEQLLGLY